MLESELTETASEGEGEYDETGRENFVSRSIQSNIEIPCEHRFSVSVLRDLVHRRGNEKKYFSHLTGFSSYEKFRRVLEFVLPGVIESTSHTGTRRRAKSAKLIRRCYSTLIKNHKVMMMGARNQKLILVLQEIMFYLWKTSFY